MKQHARTVSRTKILGGAGALLAASLLATLAAKFASSDTMTRENQGMQGSVVRSCPTSMVLIPDGTFLMGSPEGDGFDEEHPQHAERLAAFCMDRTEVTVAEYRACTTCTPPGTEESCNWGVAGRESHPVNCVNWNQSDRFCRLRGAQLPNAAQWEYAARGTEGRTYPWGNEAPASQLCWNRYPEPRSTCPVGSFAPGVFGLADMAGNVREWTNSAFSSAGGIPDNSRRFFRGGSWGAKNAVMVRGASRDWRALSYRRNDLGFRCARVL